METGALLEALGYDEDDKLVILNCDDLGMSHATNVAVYSALRYGAATSATLMVPCPWSRHAARLYRGEDVGVHLTLNSEWGDYRWGPITQAPSLVDGDGGFPRTLLDLWEHADLAEVKKELRAQIERAILWGFDVSHLDSHMGALQLKPEFFGVYLELAVEFRLPIRLSDRSTEAFVGFPFRQLAEEAGVLAPDYLAIVLTPEGVGSREAAISALENLKPGITEIYFHPAKDLDEQKAISKDWERRLDDYRLLVEETTLRDLIKKVGAKPIGYRPLRDLMSKLGTVKALD